ncbi:hypothetical protein GALL_458840 [mine drainage metagenome]|uniref:S-adenosylhomocysteine hydrolase n=1 Tax=mine drainage metagenome TaxID=410659 RepID=A0A1J5PLT5_9ZZZZ
MALSTQTRIARSIGRSKRDVFVRADFADLGSPSRVTRAISELIKKGKLVRLGYGVYAKAVPSAVTGNPIPRKVLESLVAEAFDSLGIPVDLGMARSAYATGSTSQIPMSVTVSTGSRRVSRKLKLGNHEVIYDKPLTRAS